MRIFPPDQSSVRAQQDDRESLAIVYRHLEADIAAQQQAEIQQQQKAQDRPCSLQLPLLIIYVITVIIIGELNSTEVSAYI